MYICIRPVISNVLGVKSDILRLLLAKILHLHSGQAPLLPWLLPINLLEPQIWVPKFVENLGLFG